MHISNVVAGEKYTIYVPQANETIRATCIKIPPEKNVSELFDSKKSILFQTDNGQQFELFAHKYKSAKPRLCCRAFIDDTYKTVPARIEPVMEYMPIP